MALAALASRVVAVGGRPTTPAAAARARLGRPLRRPRARSPSCAARSSSARARRARRLRAARRRGCARALPRGRFEAVPGHPGCATSSAACRARSPRSWSPRTTTRRSSGLRRRQRRRGGHRRGARARARAAPHEAAGGRAGAALRALRRRGGDRRRADFYGTGLRGSQAYARRHADELRRAGAARLRRRQAPAHPARGGLGPGAVGAPARGRRRGRRRARRSRPARRGDHSTTTRRSRAAGVPAIDLIDFDFPCWHRTLRRPERGLRRIARPLGRGGARAAADLALTVAPSRLNQ